LATSKLLLYLLDHTGTKTIFTQGRENIRSRLGVLLRRKTTTKTLNYISIPKKDETKRPSPVGQRRPKKENALPISKNTNTTVWEYASLLNKQAFFLFSLFGNNC
jgi:hypothetical protein